VVFGRLVDYAAAGLSYTVQFSSDLVYWEDSAVAPTVLVADSLVEAVSVPYPATINPPGGPVAPNYFRVKITQN
jgi:hypothetical protein